MASQAKHIPQGRVLCIAAGEGRNAVWLAQQGYDVLAVDQSEVGLAKAQLLAETRDVALTTRQATFPDFEWPREGFQGITSIFAHMPPSVRREVHAGVVTALAPGGVLILEAYRPAQVGRGTGGPPVADMMMNADLLRDELKGLDVEFVLETDRRVVEGSYHTGDASVVQLVARKRM